MSASEITIKCEHAGCTETFATGRSLWKYAAIEGREAGWQTGHIDLCPEHKVEDYCPESPDGKHQVSDGSCDQCGAKNFS